jgi:hypothetical protein
MFSDTPILFGGEQALLSGSASVYAEISYVASGTFITVISLNITSRCYFNR